MGSFQYTRMNDIITDLEELINLKETSGWAWPDDEGSWLFNKYNSYPLINLLFKHLNIKDSWDLYQNLEKLLKLCNEYRREI